MGDINNNFYSILNIESNKWNLTFKKQNHVSNTLFSSICESKLLSGSYILTKTGGVNHNSLIFFCNSITPIKNILDKSSSNFKSGYYNLAMLFIKCLIKQQHFLQKQNNAMGFIDINLDHVYIIDNNVAIYLNPSHIHPIKNLKNSNLFSLHKPFYCNLFSSPDLSIIDSLPSSISVKTYNYSLSAAAFFIVFSRRFEINNRKCDRCLDKIMNTDLYWILTNYLKNYENASSSLIVI